MKKRTVLKTIVGASAIAITSGMIAIEYACRKFPPKKNNKDKKVLHPLIEKNLTWLKEQNFEDLEINSDDGLKLKAKFLKASVESNKVLIAIHGYRSSNLKEYAYYLKFYHDLGFHILLPNNRAHGNSEGTYIGFGWLDRLDCIKWIYKMKKRFNKDLLIVLHGISMGSSTVLMASGEKLPDDVKCIISDCGFTSVLDEFEHNLKQLHVPAVFVLPTATLLSKKRVGYSFKDASTIKQVKKSITPTLFIHGDQDDYVPTYMVYDLYNACHAEKDLLIIEGAKHAESYLVNQELCEKTITDFMKLYIKD